ncbi:methyltransferase domain-containing protein [Gordonia soli]|uniref:Putative methyltransferase n=1 Tax=Gordonia soli NBRC 108243 TaxID=1223545 RepID=M0QCY9_9ACTN|nr:putative methyltransferase [Gordonia soli NBRC 108243]
MCADALAIDGGSLRCERSHSFDVARQGYVSLLDGRAVRLRSDTVDMVAARVRVHDSGLFTEIADAVADSIATLPRAGEAGSDGLDLAGVDRLTILDAGAGTGAYLAACLDRLNGESNRIEARGVGVDLSKACARAIARSHPSAAAVVADIWRALPLATGSVDAILSVFAPRNVDEFVRVLRPDGVLAVVVPEPGHLAELRAPMQMLAIGDGKHDQLTDDLASEFVEVDHRRIRRTSSVTADLVADLVAMGPTAFHRARPDIDSDAAELVAARGTTTVTVDVTVAVFARRVS